MYAGTRVVLEISCRGQTSEVSRKDGKENAKAKSSERLSPRVLAERGEKKRGAACCSVCSVKPAGGCWQAVVLLNREGKRKVLPGGESNPAFARSGKRRNA